LFGGYKIKIKIKIMKRIIRLTESDLTRIIKRVISEKVETTTMLPSEPESITLGGKKFQIRKNDATKEIVKFKITPMAYKKDNKVVPGHLGLNITTVVPNLSAYFVWDCNNNEKVSTSVSRPTGQPQIDEFNASYLIYNGATNSQMAQPTQVGTAFSSMWTGDYFNNEDGTISNMITNYCPSVK